MLSVEDFKKLLGESAKELCDSEIEQVYAQMRHLAEMAFETWAERRNNKKVL